MSTRDILEVMDKRLVALIVGVLIVGTLAFTNLFSNVALNNPKSDPPPAGRNVVVVPTDYGAPEVRKESRLSAVKDVVENIVEKAEDIAESILEPESAPLLSTYIEIISGCDPYFGGGCVNVRSGPSTEHSIVGQLRSGVVLKTSGTVSEGDRLWYKVTFDEWIRYPERLGGDWYVAGEYVRAFQDVGTIVKQTVDPTVSKKRILVDRGEQKLYAYEGDALIFEENVSTGLDSNPTPRGSFTIFKKTPSRYMQGPLPGISNDYYDLPGVPWDLYFTEQGGAIHGAYWHEKFGRQWSHGCVNLPPARARELYMWADVGTPVLVRD